MSFAASRCPNGHVTYPAHPRCPTCGAEPAETVPLHDRRGEVVTWTTSTATPRGVREPNTLAIVEFAVDGDAVRALGQVTTDDVAVGDTVEPVRVEALRDPDVGVRVDSGVQPWGGYRFAPASDP